MNIARQYQLMQAKKRRTSRPQPPKGEDPLVVARDQVRALEVKVRTKEDEIARLNRELIKATKARKQ